MSTYQARRERDPPSIPEEPTAPGGVWLGGIFPITVWSDELPLNRFFQATKPRIVWTINEPDSSAVRKRTDFTEDLNRYLDYKCNPHVRWPHLDIFSMSFPWTSEEIKEIRRVFVSGRFRVAHSLSFGYLA